MTRVGTGDKEDWPAHVRLCAALPPAGCRALGARFDGMGFAASS